MGKNFYIILISYVCLMISSCAEIDRSSESANSSLIEKVWFSAYDIVIGTALMSSDDLFAPEQTSTEKGGNSTPKNKNIYLVKQNFSGSREWIMDLGISDEESEISMSFDSSDNVYLTGYTRNGLDGNKKSGDFTVFLVKYNSSGSREWMEQIGKTVVEYGARLIVDSSDNIYVTGFYSEFELDKEFGSQNTLLAKYDSFGNREWTKPLGSTLTDFAWDVTVDSKDNIYVTGFSENSFAQNTSWQDEILLMKFDTDGIKL